MVFWVVGIPFMLVIAVLLVYIIGLLVTPWH